jgi:hypothetical protein
LPSLHKHTLGCGDRNKGAIVLLLIQPKGDILTQKWEYIVYGFPNIVGWQAEENSKTHFLNKQGEKGWELVHVREHKSVEVLLTNKKSKKGAEVKREEDVCAVCKHNWSICKQAKCGHGNKRYAIEIGTMETFEFYLRRPKSSSPEEA